MQSVESKILYNDRLAEGYYRLGLSWKTPEVKAGHFVMLRVSDGMDPLLRRPFGVLRLIGAKGKASRGTGIELLYRVVGRGTGILSAKRPGETLGILGPLGNGFPVPDKGQKVIMVTGGMGIVPLHMLAQRLGQGTLLFGARSKKETFLLEDFKGLGLKIKTATEDGSAGAKGLVTALLAKELAPECVVYACGPMGMLKAVSRLCAAEGVKCFVSLERSMACGIGVCLGCAVRTINHEARENRNYKMVCSDGPVFDSRDIDWELL
ncbi:MAG: dihydroorotate dehydrogenase electron transfer subunit [Deltaproteobacteria bacterium]|nr:dihydroorotate dehydrogenase electron transfer subunit [Deltaproteobacteria bacterium]